MSKLNETFRQSLTENDQHLEDTERITELSKEWKNEKKECQEQEQSDKRKQEQTDLKMMTPEMTLKICTSKDSKVKGLLRFNY